MGWFWNKRKPHREIDVHIIEAVTGRLVGKSLLPIDALPASFEADTTMHIGDTDWQVIEARPMTAEEFSKAGTLILRVNKVQPTQMVDPTTILFSLPTICDNLPALAANSSKLGKDVAEIHEDDWRQIEFVSATFADLVASEIQHVRSVFETARVGPGFSRVHLREAIAYPLKNTQIAVSEIAALSPNATSLAGLAYRGIAGVVANSFAVRLPSSLTLFGTMDMTDGVATANTLCIMPPHASNKTAGDATVLSSFAAHHHLILVDWCQCEIIHADAASYHRYFSQFSDA